VDLPPEVRLVGEHTSDERPGPQFVTAMVPEVAAIVSADPLANAAMGLLTTIGTVAPLVAGARTTVTVATTPLAIVASFKPAVMHVTEPLLGLQTRVLVAAPSAGPAATLRELMSLGAYENAHCKPAGAPLPPSVRFSDTVPPSTAEPPARLTEAVWLKAKLPGRKQNRQNAIHCLTEEFGMWLPGYP
jgi:hypothetical protein